MAAKRRTSPPNKTVADLAVSKAPRGDCPACAAKDALLFAEAGTEDELVCAHCYRKRARRITRSTPCDNCGADYAWRNPKHRRNEYLCGRCHAESGEGVVLNRWAGAAERLEARLSLPLGVSTREECAARNVPGTQDCQGEVKPRGKDATPLCNRHAGKDSWGDKFRAGEVR